jgi:multidrug efflux pump
VVDDAIVMIENIARYVEEGESPMAAALKGSKQIGFTIISLTISLIAVLIPLLFMADVVGRLFHEFAITLAVSILISAVVSLTLTPMLCARLLKHTPNPATASCIRQRAVSLKTSLPGYGRMLTVGTESPVLNPGHFCGTLVGTAGLYVVVPKGFFPVQDTGVIQAMTEGPQDTSFAAMAAPAAHGRAVMLQDPAVESLSSFIGVDGANATLNAGRMLINLKPKAAAPRASARSFAAWRLGRQQGARHRAVHAAGAGPDHRGPVSQDAVPVLLSSPDGAELDQLDTPGGPLRSSCPSWPTWPATCRTRGCRPIIEIDRGAAAAWASRWRPLTTRCTTPLASA